MALDEVAGQNLFEQVLQVWVQPEIDRRKAAGALPEGFTIFAIQILFHQDREQNEVRFNDQVRGKMQMRVNRSVQAGEPVYSTDVSEIAGFHLEETDANAAHITLFLLSSGWHINFDFNYSAIRVRATIEAAREFLDAARDSLAKGNMRAFAENLWGACFDPHFVRHPLSATVC